MRQRYCENCETRVKILMHKYIACDCVACVKFLMRVFQLIHHGQNYDHGRNGAHVPAVRPVKFPALKDSMFMLVNACERFYVSCVRWRCRVTRPRPALRITNQPRSSQKRRRTQWSRARTHAHSSAKCLSLKQLSLKSKHA